LVRIACCGSGVTWIAGSPSPAQYGRRRCRPVAARLRLPGSVCPVEGPGASTSRVADRGWCFGTVAWFKSLCVWAALAPMRAGSGSPHWHWRRWCGDCGLVARSGRRVLRRLSPVASLSLWGWVRVRCNPMACPGAAWVGLPRVRWWRLGGWGLVGRVTGPSSRAAGNCETCTPGQHAAQADTTSFRAVPCVGGKEAISRSDTALSRWRLQATCATRCK